MTTIAYKDGVVAYDSRISRDNIILDDNTDKLSLIDGCAFFYTGATSDQESLITAYLSGTKKVDHSIDGNALVIDSGKLFYLGVTSENEFWSAPIRNDSIFAIGSGMEFALAFMDTGLCAVDTIKMVRNRDAATGGAVRSYDLRTGHIKKHND